MASPAGHGSRLPYSASTFAAHDVPFDYEVTRGIHEWNYWHSVMKPSLVRLQEFFTRTP